MAAAAAAEEEEEEEEEVAKNTDDDDDDDASDPLRCRALLPMDDRTHSNPLPLSPSPLRNAPVSIGRPRVWCDLIRSW